MTAPIFQSPLFNFPNPSDDKLGLIGQSNWRSNPHIDWYRRVTFDQIWNYLKCQAFGEATISASDSQSLDMLASTVEKQLYDNVNSEKDYMSQGQLTDRINGFIEENWFWNQYSQQPAIQTTGTNFKNYLNGNAMKANTSGNMVYPFTTTQSYFWDAVSKESLSGTRKRSFSGTFKHPEQVLRSELFYGGGSFFNEPVNSGPTCYGSVWPYDFEPSIQSNNYKVQGFCRGELGLISNESSPAYSSFSGWLPELKPSTVSNEVCEQPSLSELPHSGGLLSQKHSENSCARNVDATHDLKARAQNLSSSEGFDQLSSVGEGCRDAVDKLLSYYIVYCKNRSGSIIPFLELLHSRNCSGGVCNCKAYRECLSHFHNCGSANCEICGPAVRAHGTISGSSVCLDAHEDLMPLAKCRKLDVSPHRSGSSCDFSGLSGDSHGPLQPVNIERQFGSRAIVSSDKPEANMGTCIHDTDVTASETSNCSVDDMLGTKSDAANIPAQGPVDFQQESDSVVPRDSENKGTDIIRNLPSDSVSMCEDQIVIQNEKVVTIPEITEPNIKREGCSPVSLTEIKSEKKQKADGVSMIDHLTSVEIEDHISSLWQKVVQDGSEVVKTAAISSVSENFCQLCGLDRLAFSPMPIYCSSCGARVKNGQTYYSTANEDRAQFCFCSTCYHKCRAGNITFYGISICKNKLLTRKNDLVTEESWVQCDKCEGWQHQICALFNDKRDLGGKAEYICPKCHLEDLLTDKHMTLPRSSLGASSLPRTLLSDYLEDRLYRRLLQERTDRAKAAGKDPEEVPQPADLVIRVVSSVEKRLKVKQQFLDIFPEKNYPPEFPYRSKVILLFQRIDGIDVCLFAMYVQEFGSECSQPNQRCVYISYLDSVKYFRPETKTVKGEALRTFVYHEILIGYLDYCKKRGFATCYIWACPPVKGEDYILYCHPDTQKTPRPDKLRQWYQSMLRKATEEKIVVNFTNLYEKFFVPNGECNTKVTAARLPYFDGDYWSGVAESMIKKIEQESGGDPEKQIKKMTRRSLKAMGHSNPSAGDAKDILLMQALAQSISSAKEDFIIVYLQCVCTHCHEVILSGKRWFCNQCKNYQICERCQVKENQEETHISSSGQRHALCQETVNDVPVDTEDNDAIMNNCFLENRHAFLNFCQGNHYQFDSLRRAKHSSMMILYHLHNPNGSNSEAFCSLCLKELGADSKWICEICPEFNVCRSCYQRNNVSCHSHTLNRQPSTTVTTAVRMVTELMDLIVHASRCKKTGAHRCTYPYCSRLKGLFYHTQKCSVRVAGGCHHCKKTWVVLTLHARSCKITDCSVPRCRDVREHAQRKKTKHNSVLPAVCKQSVQ